MVSIRGPRSALTDFIKEQGLNELIIRSKTSDVIPQQAKAELKRPKKAPKRGRVKLPTEIVNLDAEKDNPDSFMVEKIELILKTPQIRVFQSEGEIEEFSRYCALNRCLSAGLFVYICQNTQQRLHVYDCADIPNSCFLEILEINDNLKELHLFFCGQLQTETINVILQKYQQLERLSITGAHLVTNLNLPASLKHIDVSHCCRLGSEFVDDINEKFESLEFLNISFCQNIQRSDQLKTRVENLLLAETSITDQFFTNSLSKYVKKLNISMCPLVYPADSNDFRDILSEMTNIESLNITGISKIEKLPTNKITELWASACHLLSMEEILHCKNLKILDISKRDIDTEMLSRICELNNLEYLNLSWVENVDDSLFFELVGKLHKLKRIEVYGCFFLTSTVGEYAWKNKDKIEVVGNPAETRFLLGNDQD